MEVLREIWHRATAEQPAPAPAVVALMAVLAAVLVLTPAVWPVTRMLVTVTHEGGHAVAALLSGRRLRGIRLHTDTSGLTVSSGRASGPGMVATLAAGYLGPAVVGLGAVLLLLSGHSLGLLWLLVLLLAAMLLQIRNLYGFAVLLASAVVLVGLSWYLPAQAQSTVAYLLTWTLLIAAPKPVLELIRQRRRGGTAHSDPDQLGRLTHTPGGLWAALFLVADVLGLALGSALLLPALAALARSGAAGLAGVLGL
ncbi:MAG: family metallopeptidase [Friedmanniella sp.]|nr:family metallopeptidase [Friedmanniella sp.]